MGSILHVKRLIESTQNLQTKNTTNADIYIALQNAGEETRCGRPTDSSKKMKSFLDSPVDRGQRLLMVRVWQMIRVGTQQFDMDISVTKTMYKLVLIQI